jgi:hypothetical protein
MQSTDMSRTSAGGGGTSPPSRDAIRDRLQRVKHWVLAATLVAALVIWNLVAHHTVGVTAQTTSPAAPPTATQPPSNVQDPGSSDFFGGGSPPGSVNGGGGYAQAPVVGSGAS